MSSSPLWIHAINIFVRDQERSLRFYVDQLGFKVAFDTTLQSGQRWLAVSPPDGITVLSLIAPKPGTVEYKMIGRATRVVFITEDVAARFREWTARGVRFRQTPRLKRLKFEKPAAAPGHAPPSKMLGEQTSIWGSVFARFEDVDRNSFALVSFDEVNRAVEEHRRLAAQKLEAERRAAQELEIATQVQARLFPQTLPPLKTLDYAGVCIQARRVGGDYYDFLNLGQGRLGLVVGDISGKGMAAALLMANLQANLRSQCAIARDHPARFLQSVNELFRASSTESAYATLFFAEYDDDSGHLRYVNCGHLCGLLLRRDGSLDRLESTSTVLGLFPEWDCATSECRLAPGDLLALYTDGITESFNDHGEDFGEHRLIDVLRRRRELPTRQLLDAIVDEVRQFSPEEQQDDITVIAARCRGAA